jgi:hypothetical protein
MRALVVSSAILASNAVAAELRVMTTGQGSGRVIFSAGGPDCTSAGGPACTRELAGAVTLTPVAQFLRALPDEYKMGRSAARPTPSLSGPRRSNIAAEASQLIAPSRVW